MAEYIKDLISVIVPVYNTEKYIARCLDSIINQTYKKLEIIVVDDGSTDNSYEACKEYEEKDDRIVVLHQENKGLVVTRKIGIDSAKGEFVAFVDSDDYIEITMYEDMMSKKGDADLVSCAMSRHISEDKGNDDIVYRKDLFDKSVVCDENFFDKMIYDFESETLLRISPSVCNKLFIHNKIDEFYKNLNIEIYNSEDFLFTCNYVLQCKSIYFLDKPLYHYCFRNDSCVHSIRENELSNFNKLYIELKKIFKNHYMSESLVKQLQKYIQIFVIRAMNLYMGFDKSIRIPRYMPDIAMLKGKKIAVYGAGIVGQDVMFMLNKFNYDVTLWVDKNHSYYRELGLDVCDIEKLLEVEYDVILIAIESQNVMLEIKNNLIDLGIDNKKIIAENLKCIF